MKNKNLLHYNLQFFAEEGEEVQEVADPGMEEEVTGTEDEVTEEVEEEPEEEPVQDAETNAQFAAARRRAEAEYKAELQKRDAEYARRFEGLTNPITGAPIKSERDYFDALDAQEQLARNEELRNAGIDPSIIDRAIANNPMVRQAQQILEIEAQNEAQRQIESDWAEINRLDPSVKGFADIPTDVADKIMERVHNGLSLVDAYKMENFDRLMEMNRENSKNAAAQKAINDAKSKGHLNNGKGASDAPDGLVDIPESQLAHFRAAFPDDTPQQLKQRYNAIM